MNELSGGNNVSNINYGSISGSINTSSSAAPPSPLLDTVIQPDDSISNILFKSLLNGNNNNYLSTILNASNSKQNEFSNSGSANLIDTSDGKVEYSGGWGEEKKQEPPKVAVTSANKSERLFL